MPIYFEKYIAIQAFTNEIYHFIIISFGTSAGFSVLFLQEMLQKSLKMS